MAEHAFENIGWTVGNHCNATCGHCYSWKVRKDSREFLLETDVVRVVEQLARLGIKTVNLGGNEPIYTHGPELGKTMLPFIIRTLHDAAIPVGLTTNGVTFTYLYDHFPDELRMVNDIDFSLDSPFQKEHDLNRGVKLYKLVIHAIERAIELGIDCSIIACGMRQNFNKDYLSAYMALTKMLGCEFRINTLKPVEPDLIGEMPSSEQFYEGFSFLMNNSHCITLGESCVTAFTETGTPGCPCGTSSFRINAKTKDGRIPINPCVYAHDYKVGDLLTEDIFDIVSSPAFTAFSGRRRHLPQACRDSGCSYLETCRGGCTSRSYFVYGNLESKDPYCPAEYVASRGGSSPNLPHRPEIGCHDGIRVHDNYLCTWIGKVNPDFVDERYSSIAQFFDDPEREATHMSNCKQVKPSENDQTSLIRIERRRTGVTGS